MVLMFFAIRIKQIVNRLWAFYVWWVFKRKHQPSNTRSSERRTAETHSYGHWTLNARLLCVFLYVVCQFIQAPQLTRTQIRYTDTAQMMSCASQPCSCVCLMYGCAMHPPVIGKVDDQSCTVLVMIFERVSNSGHFALLAVDGLSGPMSLDEWAVSFFCDNRFFGINEKIFKKNISFWCSHFF